MDPASKSLSTAMPNWERVAGLIHASKVQLSVAVNGTLAKDTKSSTPSKLNAWPTSPAAKVAPLVSVPLLPPMMSVALPSAGHHPTSPDGADTQDGGAPVVSERHTENSLVFPLGSV